MLKENRIHCSKLFRSTCHLNEHDKEISITILYVRIHLNLFILLIVV